MKRHLFFMMCAACGPDYTPTRLPWPVHVVTAAADHTLVLTDVDVALDAGTVESDGTPIALPDDGSGTPMKLMLPTATAVAVGSAHACVVTATQVQCWGDNSGGALGAHRSCIDCVLAPGVMPTLPPVRAVAAGTDVTCATTLDDTVMCWGANAHGELGGSTVSALDPPVPIYLPDDKPLYADRVMISESTACAIDRARDAWCWGDGFSGLVRLPLTGVVDVSVGHDHGCAIASDGLTCWGDNVNGQVDGIGQTASLLPTHVALDAVRVVVGARHTCALGSTGTVTCWGSNEHGQLARSDTYLVGAPGTAFDGAVDLVAGATHTCAVTASHQAWCWGDR